MYESMEFEESISESFRETFGCGLVVNRFGGVVVPIHVGDKPVVEPGEDYFSPDFAMKFRDLPLLANQGNGMKAFFDLICRVVGSNAKSAIFIDEPELFLHPPQSRKLGRFLAEKTAANTQLFVATHDGPFIRGILNSGSDRVRVIRIERDKEVNSFKQLQNEDIANLWKDTVLKYSNVLDGLFHEQVVVCESDSDCQFFAALRDEIEDTSLSDVLFVSAGGKDRVAVVAKALTAIGVKTKAVLDFDVLNQPLAMTRIVDALGGDWAALESDYKLVQSAVESRRPELDKDKVFSEIKELFGDVDTKAVPRSVVRKVNGILKRSSLWAAAKDSGFAVIPPGDPSKAWGRLHANCLKLGFCIIEFGELESFVREIGGHGQKWVNEVLRLDLATDGRLENARNFVKRLFNATKP